MAAESPEVIERRMYVDMHLNGVDDPTLTLAELRSMGGGSSHVYRAATVRQAEKGSGGMSESAVQALIDTSLVPYAKLTEAQKYWYRGPSYGGAVANVAPVDFVKTYRVTGGTTSVALGTYATIAAAITQLQADQKTQFANLAADLSRQAPTLWRRILVSAGNYNETVSVPDYTALVGETGNYDDVRIFNAGTAFPGSGAVLTTTGSTCYIEGITFDYTDVNEKWHPWRDAGPSGNADMNNDKQRRTVIVRNCKFYTSNANSNMGSACLDSTWGQGAFMLCIDCYFQQDNGSQVINCVLNSNGSATHGPSTVVFINPKLRMNYGTRVPMSAPVGGDGSGPANPVGLVDFGIGRGDRFYWQGGQADFGDGFDIDGITKSGIAGLITASYQPVSGAIQSSKWYIDPELPTKNSLITWPDVVNSGVATVANIVRNNALPSLPRRGLSAQQETAYRPHPYDLPLIDYSAGTLRPAITTAKAALTANRIYYVRIPMERAFEAGMFLIGATAAKGVNVAGAIYADDGTGAAPSTDGNLRQTFGPSNIPQSSETILVGSTTTRRPWYGAHKYVWLAFVCDSATPTFDTATNQTDFPVMYQDGWAGAVLGAPAGLAALPGATAFPVPFLKHIEKSAQAVITTVGTTDFFIPDGCKALDVILIGGGGGGGSGARNVAGGIRTGGGGGAGGAIGHHILPAQYLGNKVQIQIIAGGSGGAGATVDGNGAAGSTGRICILKNSAGAELARSAGGGGGAAGSTTAASGGTAANGAMGASGAGGASSTTGNGVGGPNIAANIGAPGGGGGGNITAANAQFAGGSGGVANGIGPNSGPAGGTAGGGVGTAGSEIPTMAAVGYGGGGGGGNNAGAGGDGGNGGAFGGGGGGGGSSLSGFISGKGGDGGPAAAIITPLF